jgi:predicted  nucleic acid-binding Zn-ribbon protein
MAITKQLYQLQELDIELEQTEQTMGSKTGELGKREALDNTKSHLFSERQQLEKLKHQHHDAEWQVDDLLNKIAAAEKQLYGGRITNPKELSSLQHEVNTMKARSDQLENKALEIIDQVETAEQSLTAASSEYQKLEEEWRRRQQQLTDEIELLKKNLADITEKRQQLVEQIEPPAIELYEKIRQQKKQAVAKVEQGICRACRISLSASALQKARSGQPVQCGSCGRILFIS